MKKYKKPIPYSKFSRVIAECDLRTDLVNSKLSHVTYMMTLGQLLGWRKSFGVVKEGFVYFKEVPEGFHYQEDITYWRLRVKPKVAYMIDEDYKEGA